MSTGDELLRYERQIMIDGLGIEGQEKLKMAKVIIAGAGGLGSIISIYLAIAGIGKIRLIDHDYVELSNLNRQILFGDKDIGKIKVEIARQKLKSLNKESRIEAIKKTITEDNVFKLVDGYDLIVDAMDNFSTRFILNKVAVQKKIPLFHGAVRGFEGRATTIIPGQTPCLNCLYPQVSEPGTSPVIGVAPAVIGSIQTTEVIKHIVGTGVLLTNRLLIYDGLDMEFMEIQILKNPDCKVCYHLWENKI